MQRQIRGLADPLHDEGPMRLQNPLAVSAHLARRDRAGGTVTLRPLHYRRNCDAKTRRHRTAALAGADCFNNTLTKIVRKGSCHQMLASVQPAS
ncbi:hypothetical protein AJ88_41735 [Mesorhizobium amorphae CCBAU 01583]|nr:hypothetical protein AJ88_41735 [Mesorhizobium amorphae CCBAU 01583]